MPVSVGAKCKPFLDITICSRLGSCRYFSCSATIWATVILPSSNTTSTLWLAFNGAGFVRVNVTARGSVNAVEGAQGGGDSQVGLCARHHKINVRIRTAHSFWISARATSQYASSPWPAVSSRLVIQDANFRRAAGSVVTGKIIHLSSFVIWHACFADNLKNNRGKRKQNNAHGYIRILFDKRNVALKSSRRRGKSTQVQARAFVNGKVR